ncbi:MAG: hypothetical protein HYV28_05545 [Ignavibacteriales bacterium]|nr:hypothetical protein [Ignavibacteriales bacterium]
MDFITFTREMKTFPAFSLKETGKLSGKVYYHRIIEWQKKGYIKRIANSIYMFADEDLDEMYLYYIANRLYEPSYISLESAFAFHSFIPDAVYGITSVTSKKTATFRNDNLVFSFRTLHRKYNFAYSLINWRNVTVKMAEPEKAVIDYFYLNPHLNSIEQIEGMRFNALQMKEKLDWDKISGYLTIYENKTLCKRIALLKEMVDNA